MKKCFYSSALIVSLVLASAPSFAVGTWGGNSDNKPKLDEHVCALAPKNPHCKPGSSTVAAPEIDGANAGLALALIGGLLMIRRERRSK